MEKLVKDSIVPHSLKKQSTYLFLGRVFSLIISYIVPVILVRVLTQEEYGIYQQFHLITLTFIPILNMGLGSSLYYFYPISDENQKSMYIGQTYVVLHVVGALFAMIYILLGVRINSFVGVETLNDYRLVIPIYILFMIVSNLSDVIFTIEKKIFFNLLYFPIDKLIRTVLLIAFAIYFSKSAACIYALFFYSLIRFFFISLYLFKHIKVTLSSFKFSLLLKQIKYSLPFAGAIFINTVGKRIDKLLLNNLISVEEFAIYSVAFFSLPLVSQTTSSIQSVLVPDLSENIENNKIEEAANLWKKSVTTIASVNFPIIVFFLGYC